MTGTECQGGNCCDSPAVTGGTFDQGEPDAFQSTVSSFRMDRYEVVVARFRRFVAAYEAWRIAGNPTTGSGAHPQIANSGWNTAWSNLLPASAAALTSIVQCNTDYASWKDAQSADALPMNCISWYEAFAFCIWDGGRLPTESEWEYAAVRGSEDTLYPWGNTPVPDNLDGTLAVYNCLGDGMTGCLPADIRPVGSKPLGRGRYLHEDLSGSLWEWVFDSFAAYPTSARTNYANVDAGNTRAARGGHWAATAADIRSATRHARDATDRYYGIYGFRCARAP
jgi:formylglycine-generating enzyme required for sulfatase activity